VIVLIVKEKMYKISDSRSTVLITVNHGQSRSTITTFVSFFHDQNLIDRRCLILQAGITINLVTI